MSTLKTYTVLRQLRHNGFRFKPGTTGVELSDAAAERLLQLQVIQIQPGAERAEGLNGDGAGAKAPAPEPSTPDAQTQAGEGESLPPVGAGVVQVNVGAGAVAAGGGKGGKGGKGK
jgi:hypothetical protein